MLRVVWCHVESRLVCCQLLGIRSCSGPFLHMFTFVCGKKKEPIVAVVASWIFVQVCVFLIQVETFAVYSVYIPHYSFSCSLTSST